MQTDYNSALLYHFSSSRIDEMLQRVEFCPEWTTFLWQLVNCKGQVFLVLIHRRQHQFRWNQEWSYLFFLEFSLFQTFLIAVLFLICLLDVTKVRAKQKKYPDDCLICFLLLHFDPAQHSTVLCKVQPGNWPVFPEKTVAGQNQRSYIFW